MGWLKRMSARGEVPAGRISAHIVAIGDGVAVVSDAALAELGRPHFERLNGGTQVYAASELGVLQDC